MIDPKDYYELGFALHGHKCPAMPLGIRAGAAAMNALEVERAKDGQLLALVELGEAHFATCFADGVQAITGCTFGKGNLEKLHWGKWGLTLVEVASGRAVRVAPRAEAIGANMKTEFFREYRAKGVPASKVPPEVVAPLVERVLGAPAEKLLQVGEPFHYDLTPRTHSFSGLVCDECGEMVVEGYVRIVGDKKVCIPCREKLIGARQ